MMIMNYHLYLGGSNDMRRLKVPTPSRTPPFKMSFDDAFDDLKLILQFGLQWFFVWFSTLKWGFCWSFNNLEASFDKLSMITSFMTWFCLSFCCFWFWLIFYLKVRLVLVVWPIPMLEDTPALLIIIIIIKTTFRITRLLMIMPHDMMLRPSHIKWQWTVIIWHFCSR